LTSEQNNGRINLQQLKESVVYMTTKIDFISKKSYGLIGRLEDEIDALEQFADHSGYICDAISEIADSYIPIYDGDVWANISDISDFVEDAISEGIAPVSSGDVDLIRIFQSGYYIYYQQSLYDNLEELVYNYVVDKVNDYLNTLDDTSNLDMEAIEGEIENATGNIDNNDTFSDLDDIVTQITESIDNEEFGEF
jgi:hypothetical protein